MELIGTLKKISDLQTFPSGFQKKDAVILTEEQYPQPINVEFLSEKADLLNNCKVDDKVKISINLRGREWTSPAGEVKYFNSIIGWKLEKLEGGFEAQGPITPPPTAGKSTTTKDENVFDSDDEDGLPF